MAEGIIPNTNKVIWKSFGLSEAKSIDLPAGGVYYNTIVSDIEVAGYTAVSVSITSWGTLQKLINVYISADRKRVGAMSETAITIGSGQLAVTVTYVKN